MNDRRGAIVCSHVASGSRPIRRAEHSPPVAPEDSGWQFVCDCEVEDPAAAQVWTVSQVISLDPSIEGLLIRPIGSAFVRQLDRWVDDVADLD